MKALIQLKEFLSNPKMIVVTHHHNSDYDALGSTLGLKFFLEKMGHQAVVVSPNPNAEYLQWLPGMKEVVVYESDGPKTQQLFDEADALFSLDFNIFHRTKNLAPLMESYGKVKVLLDHHLQPDLASFDYGCSNPAKSSTSEMVYDFMRELDGLHLMDKTIATCLYIGAVADTGGFKYASTTAETLEMAANLMRTGIDASAIQERAFDTKDEKYLRLLGYVLNENMEIFEQANASLIHISRPVYKKYNIQPGGTEGLVNYPLSIRNIIFSTFMVEHEDEIKLSLRSQGNFDVSKIAAQYFNGGGHKNASGGRTDLSLEETITIFKTILKTHKNELQQCYNELQSAV